MWSLQFVDQKSFASLSGLVKENSLLELPVFITCTVPQSEFCVHLLLESSSTKASLLLNLAITDFLRFVPASLPSLPLDLCHASCFHRRPLTMNMEQFALDWAASPSAEKIIQIKASDLSSDGDVMTAGSIMTTLGTQLNFSTVASEGKSSIFHCVTFHAVTWSYLCGDYWHFPLLFRKDVIFLIINKNSEGNPSFSLFCSVHLHWGHSWMSNNLPCRQHLFTQYNTVLFSNQ